MIDIDTEIGGLVAKLTRGLIAAFKADILERKEHAAKRYAVATAHVRDAMVDELELELDSSDPDPDPPDPPKPRTKRRKMSATNKPAAAPETRRATAPNGKTPSTTDGEKLRSEVEGDDLAAGRPAEKLLRGSHRANRPDQSVRIEDVKPTPARAMPPRPAPIVDDEPPPHPSRPLRPNRSRCPSSAGSLTW